MCNTKSLQKSIKHSGFVVTNTSVTKVARIYNLAFNYKDNIVPSFGLAMLNVVEKNVELQEETRFGGLVDTINSKFSNHQIKANDKGEVLSYLYDDSVFRSVSAIDVLKSKHKQDIFAGKFVVLGFTAISLSSPYLSSNDVQTPSLYTHASFLEHVLSDDLLYMPSFAKSLACMLSFLFIVLIAYFNYANHYIKAAFICLFGIIASLVVVCNMLDYGIYVPVGFFLIPTLVLYVILLFVSTYIFHVAENNYLKQTQNIRTSIVNSMMKMIESRDSESGKHILRTQFYAQILSRHLSENGPYKKLLDEKMIQYIYEAAPLHDIGKIGVPEDILEKPDKLTDEEMDIVKKHSEIGYNIIQKKMNKYNANNEFLKVASNIVYTHHEKWDGSGYPNGLKGEQIPLEGRIIALVDVYDALTNRRAYKDAFSCKESESIIMNGRGTHFDPVIVDAFFELKSKFRDIAYKFMD